MIANCLRPEPGIDSPCTGWTYGWASGVEVYGLAVSAVCAESHALSIQKEGFHAAVRTSL